MKKIIKTINLLLLCSWLFVLPLRSILYIVRTIKEFTGQHQDKYSYIKTCSDQSILTTVEEKRVYNYKNLGEKCEK